MLANAASANQQQPLSKAVLDDIGQNIFRCYQCVKCTSGCPLADQFDLTPNQVMRCLQLNEPSVLESRAIWLCASCQTCASRCPQEIDVTGVMDTLRIEAGKRGIAPAIPDVQKFHWLFMKFISSLGRVPELLFVLVYKLLRGKPFADAGIGLRLLKKGKLKPWPHFARTPTKVVPLAEPEDKVAYFPGCSASSSAREYDLTVRSTAEVLNIKLVEPPGWVCCGSSSAHACDSTLASVFPLRTMSTIERMGMTSVTSPCSNCFARLKMAEYEGAHNSEALAQTAAITDYQYRGTVKVQHFVDTILDHATPQQISEKVTRPLEGLKVACYYGCLITRPAQATGAEKVTRPLQGLKVACYYGCLITRPAQATGAENPEYPMQMDRLLRSLGAETVDWSYKTDCCGGSLSVTQTEQSLRMSEAILEDAKACGAEAVITMCPMCHMNLDARQPDMDTKFDMPIFHSTQLTTLAFGLDVKRSHLNKNIVDPLPLLKSKGLV